MDTTMVDVPPGESLPQCPRCGEPVDITETGSCRACGAFLEVIDESEVPEPGFLSMPEMRYPDAYTWVVLFAGLDILLTLFVLFIWRGHEVNPITAAVINTMGPTGALLFKLGTVVLVIVICEVLGRRDDRMGRRLAKMAVVLSAMPVLYTFAVLLIAGPAPVDGLNGNLG